MMRAGAIGATVAASAFGAIALVAGIESEDDTVRGADRVEASTSSGVAAGRTLFARMGCGSCHALAAAGSSGQIGPDLAARLGGHTTDSLVAVIADPPRVSAMPRDFGSRMSARELDALAAFLIAARGG